MDVNPKQRCRHSAAFKAQVLAACAEPGASVAAVALSFGLNDNLVHQWRRGRGASPVRSATTVAAPAWEFVVLSLPTPAPPPASAPSPTAAAPAETIRLELTYARTRQFDQFLSSPDQTGHSSTTYVYKTAARPVAAAPSDEGGSESHTMSWIALALLLAAGLPLAAVLWARS